MARRSSRRRPRRGQPSVVPTTVWVTGQRDPSIELVERGYHIDTAADTGRIPPAVAEYAIGAYSPPAGTVLDPDCGAGTVVIEALRSGRHVIGLATTRGWRTLAHANIHAIRASGTATDAMVLMLTRRRDTLRTAQAAGLTESIDLVLTAAHTAPGHDPAVLTRTLTEVRPLLRPGGHVVVIAARTTGHLSLRTLAAVLAAGRAAGLVPVERCVALDGKFTRDSVTDRAPRAARRAAHRQSRDTGHPIAITAHHDVLAFCVAAADSAALPQPASQVVRDHRDAHNELVHGVPALRAA